MSDKNMVSLKSVLIWFWSGGIISLMTIYDPTASIILIIGIIGALAIDRFVK